MHVASLRPLDLNSWAMWLVGLASLASACLTSSAILNLIPDNVTVALVNGFMGSYLQELDPSATKRPPERGFPRESPADAGPDWGRDPPPIVRGDWSLCALWVGKGLRAVVATIPHFEVQQRVGGCFQSQRLTPEKTWHALT